MVSIAVQNAAHWVLVLITGLSVSLAVVLVIRELLGRH